MFKKFQLINFAALAFASCAGTGLGLDSDSPKEVASVEGITEYQLSNGLRLLLFPDNSRPSVTVNLTVFVGSRHEGYGETGMAHLLEHMVFKGTPTHPNIPRALQERGARFNGTTSVDRTNYYETLPAGDDNLEFAIRLEADRMVNSYIKREDLFSEMTVVRNEFEMGENSPSSVLGKRIMAAAYEWHNYGKSTIGNRSDIERVPIENLQAFYRKFYQPDNAMVVVAGQFGHDMALKLVQKYFGSIPRPDRKLDTTYTEEPAQDGERVVMLRRVGEVGAVGAAYHIPAGSHPDFPALQVLSGILSTPPSGRLYTALVETKKATGAYAYARSMHDPGVFMVQAEVARDGSLDDVRDTMLKVVEEVGSVGVSEQEVERAKLQLLNYRQMAAARTSRLAVTLSEWAAQGDWRLYFLHRDWLEKVTADDVQRVAGEYLRQNNRTLGVYIPTEEAVRIAVPSRIDLESLVADYEGRSSIAEGEAFDPTPENIEARTKRETLPEGIKVAMLPKKTRGEEVYANLALRYGNDASLVGKVEAASFLPQLMLRGTKKLSRQQLIDELDKLQADISAGGGRRRRGGGGAGAGSIGSLVFSIQAKRETFPQVLDILRQVLREPELAENEFEVLKRARIASLQRQLSEPSARGPRALSRMLSPYSKDDVRYIPTFEEQIGNIESVTVDHVRDVYNSFIGSGAGELSIVGDFDPYECTKVLKDTFTDWTASQSYARVDMPEPADVSGGQYTVETPDKANATYAAGLQFALRKDHPDYPALVMANYILGGGSLSSRLGDRVRQRDGLSYGVGSNFSASALDARASLTIRAISNPENIKKVDAAVREEVEKLWRDGVTGEELERAKAGYLKELKVGRTSDGALTSLLGRLLFEGRTMEFYRDLEKKIDGLTVEQVSEAFRRHVDPDKLVVVSAGDF